jgi:hypothetical protein
VIAVIAFAWLQHRTRILLATAVVGALAVVAVAAGAHLRGNDQLRELVSLLLLAVPAMVGMFWGAPLLAGEFETGTFRLAWTQSVTRTRWAALRLGVLGLAGTALVGLVSLLVTWWAGPLDRAGGDRFLTFDMRDLAPVGYTAFAFALGAAAGVLIRRVLPAMAATFGGFVAARVVVAQWVRPNLMAPVRLSLPLDPASTGYGGNPFSASTLQPEPPHLPNAWIISLRVVDGGGRPLTAGVLSGTCPGLGARASDEPRGGLGHRQAPQSTVDRMHDCVTRIGATYHEAVAYQPAQRYWPLQWCELVIFLGASVALVACCLWWVRLSRAVHNGGI